MCQDQERSLSLTGFVNYLPLSDMCIHAISGTVFGILSGNHTGISYFSYFSSKTYVVGIQKMSQ